MKGVLTMGTNHEHYGRNPEVTRRLRPQGSRMKRLMRGLVVLGVALLAATAPLARVPGALATSDVLDQQPSTDSSYVLVNASRSAAQTFTAGLTGDLDRAPAVPQSFTVAPAPLTITANTQTMVLHGAVPAFTASFSPATGAAGLSGRLLARDECGAPSPSGDPVTMQSSYGRPLPAAHYRVDRALMQLYCGQYVLKTAARSARLSGGTLQIAVNAAGYLYGVGEFYGYDAQGYQSSLVAALWNFHLTAPGVMSIDLLSLMTWVPLGRLVVHRATNGDLSGHIILGLHSDALSWHKLRPQ